MTLAGRRPVTAALAVAAVLVLVTACAGDVEELSLPSSPPAPVTTEAPSGSSSPAPDCGDPVASYAPEGPLPPPGSMPADTYMAEIQQRERLVVGVSADTLLFGFRNPITGQLEGFDIDIARQVAEAIFGDPDRIEYRVLTFAERIPALQSGDVDLVANVFTMNCSRWAEIAFSSQYYDAGKRLLVRTDSDIAGVDDLADRRVCAAAGSTTAQNLEQRPEIEVVPVDDVSDCMVLFQQQDVDVVVSDDTVLAGFAVQDPYAKVVGEPFTDEPYGLGISQDHPEFVRFVNGVLEQIRADGTWAEIYDQNVKQDPSEPTPAPPAPVYGRVP